MHSEPTSSSLSASATTNPSTTTAQPSTTTSTTTTSTQPQPAAAPSQQPPPTRKVNKCKMSGCSDKVVKIVGTCRYCTHNFCAKHRLPEAHSCQEMQTCKQAAHSNLAGKLLGEKCVASKV
ncbi:hypothetical protein HKX48_007458 [Thoreauomyces humboldtii]|nr:hypothetical protein HKX48_007458 [Thoreauomyces humboldtii]